MNKQYNILSPDGFSIRNEDFDSKEEAIKFFREIWIKRFEQQGYYSSNNGRIPLCDLEESCTLVEN